jgi:hypothetical protein
VGFAAASPHDRAADQADAAEALKRAAHVILAKIESAAVGV